MTAPDISQFQLASSAPADQLIHDVRASDADRDRAIDMLNGAFAEGRLTMEEHDARVEHAYGARTHAELAAVSADLPTGPLGTRPAHRSDGPADRVTTVAYRRTNGLAVAALVCGLIPGITQLAAIVLGIEALRQTRRTGERGTALAAAGLVLGTLSLVLTVFLILQ